MLMCFLIFLMLGLVYFPFGKDKTVCGVPSDRQGSMLWLCIFLWSKCQLNTILIVILTHLAWWGNLDIVEVEQLILFKCLCVVDKKRYVYADFLSLISCVYVSSGPVCLNWKPTAISIRGRAMETYLKWNGIFHYFIVKWIKLFTVCSGCSVIIPASVHDSNSY